MYIYEESVNLIKSDNERTNNLSNAFLQLGCQYYAIARYCAPNVFTQPVCGTIFHHAVEMLIKGYLVKSYTLADLKQVGHNLSNLWSMLQLTINDTNLSRYNNIMTDLDRIEALRYPDTMVDEGFIIKVSLGVVAPTQISEIDNLPHYSLIISELDDIVLTILTACKVNPKAGFNNAPAEFVRTLPASLRPYD